MSLEISSTIPDFNQTDHSRGDDKIQGLLDSLHEVVENWSTLTQSNGLDSSDMDSSSRAFTQLYIDQIEAHFTELKKSLSAPERNLADDGSLNSITKVQHVQSEFELDMQRLKNCINEDLNKIKEISPEKGAEKFEQTVSETLSNQTNVIKEVVKEKINKFLESALNYFYINTLDSYPDLHPDFNGFSQERLAQYYSEDIVSFLENHEEIDENGKEALLNCSLMLQNANCFERIRKNSKIAVEQAKMMEGKIQNLQIGESCLFLGGTATHAVIYEIIRESKECCLFTIINTGADEKGAKNRKPRELPADSSQYAHKSYLVKSKVLDHNFLVKLIQPKDQRIGMADVVENINHHLKGKGAEPRLGRLHQSQERGSCAAKSIASWLKGELIRRLGPEKGVALHLQLKHFRAKRNFNAILKLENEIPIEHFQDAYGKRVYKENKNSYEEKILISKTPATKLELSNYMKDLHLTAGQVIHFWQAKAQAAKSKTAVT
jgi:hypothetical protein